MKIPYFASSVLSLAEQEQVADAFGLKYVSHEFLEFQKEVVLQHRQFRDGEALFHCDTKLNQALYSQNPKLIYTHPLDSLTLISKENELSFWERVLPYPWGFIKGLTKKQPEKTIAEPLVFQNEVREFFGSLDKIENVVSNCEIAALYIQGTEGPLPLIVRFVRKKCMGIVIDPIVNELHVKNQNRELGPKDLHALWGTSSVYFELDFRLGQFPYSWTFKSLSEKIEHSLGSSHQIVRYSIPTFEESEFEIGF